MGLKPIFVEQAIEFSLDDLVVVCKLDAVFKSGDLYEIVDWKSGAVPDDGMLQSRKIQLALYRIALSKWMGVPIERIRASFFYAADGVEISPADLPSERALVEMIQQAKTIRLS